MERVSLIYNKFFRGMRWNAAEALFFYGTLIIHQIFMFKIAGPVAYGKIGTLFAVSYFIEYVLDFGFLSSIGPFFSWTKSNQNNFRSWFFWVLVPQIILFLCIPPALILSFNFFKFHYGHTSIVEIFVQNQHALLIFSFVLALDGIRRTLNGILQVAFLNKMAAIIEIINVCIYMAVVWGMYFYGIPLNLYSVFTPYIFTTLISIIFFSIVLKKWFSSLPKSKEPAKIPLKRIIISRIFNSAHETSTQFFSQGFLVPLFAIHIGIQQAGIFQLISSIEQYTRSIIKRIFSLTSNALLSHVKDATLACKQKSFAMATKRLNFVLYFVLVVVLVNISKFAAIGTSIQSFVMWPMIYFFFVIMFSHNFFILYERFYIIEEKVHYLFGVNLAFIFASAAILYVFKQDITITIYSIFSVIRILYYIGMIYLAQKLWKTRSNWRIKPILMGAFIAIALIIYVIL